MRRVIASTVGTITVVHGLIHLLGVAKGFGWADVDRLTEPIDAPMGAAWLAAGSLVVVSAALMAVRRPGWWAVALVAAAASQAVIVTSWADAKAGTAANALLVASAAWGVVADGPFGLRARFRRLAHETRAAALAEPRPVTGPIDGRDLAALPPPVAAFVRTSGAVGRPHVIGFDATIHGRIRSGPEAPWMPFTGRQVNTFGSSPSRVFLMDATMRGLPADVLHSYVGSEATMQVRAASVVPVIRAGGPQLTRAETVTLLNDLCVFAPAALVDAPITWTPIDDHRARAAYRNAGHDVAAVLVFDDDHHLVDFVSDDRVRMSPDGSDAVPERWSTPITEHRTLRGRTIGAVGRGRWHPTDAPAFDYLEIELDDIEFVEPRITVGMPARSRTA